MCTFICIHRALQSVTFAWEVICLTPAISVYLVIFRIEKMKIFGWEEGSIKGYIIRDWEAICNILRKLSLLLCMRRLSLGGSPPVPLEGVNWPSVLVTSMIITSVAMQTMQVHLKLKFRASHTCHQIPTYYFRRLPFENL